MNIRPTEARRTAAAAVLIAGLAVTGCSAINYQATTHEYSASDGVIFEAEDVKLRHIMFVAAEENAPARMLGSVSNSGTADAEVEFTVEGESFDFQLEPGETVNMENDEEIVVSSIGAAPGSMQELSVSLSVDGAASEETLRATVLDGTIEEYRDLLPDGFDESMVEHLEHGPDTYGGGAAHFDPEDAGH